VGRCATLKGTSITMKTPLFALSLITFALQGAPAPAQTFAADAQSFVADADSSAAPAAPTCFKLQDPTRSCLLVGNTVVDYQSPHFKLVDLNGAWAGPGNETPYIYIYGEGNPIFVEMSLLNRPDGFGYFVDQDTIVVVFPDDRDYTGTLIDSNTILWSNDSIWRKR
jgi:hypothetical protein